MLQEESKLGNSAIKLAVFGHGGGGGWTPSLGTSHRHERMILISLTQSILAKGRPLLGDECTSLFQWGGARPCADAMAAGALKRARFPFRRGTWDAKKRMRFSDDQLMLLPAGRGSAPGQPWRWTLLFWEGRKMNDQWGLLSHGRTWRWFPN